MLQQFELISLRSVDASQVIVAMAVSLLCGVMISLVYRWTYRGSSYAPTFMRSIIFMAMITAIVMLAIGNNLARAFGLVGAMSIIRFRTAVKDPQDIVFIFFSLAVGLAAGVGLYSVALLGTLGIGLVIAITSRMDYGALHRKQFLLQLSYDSRNNGEATYIPVLDQYCRKHKLINVRAGEAGDRLDLTFYVDLRRKEESEALTKALREMPAVRNVNLFYDEEQM
jgi:uncharacterized membrane protein YhiD involved in acid resistance